MCGSEPCRHERDYTTAQAMKSYVAASVLAGDAAIERDALKAELTNLRMEIRLLTIGPAHQHHAGKITPSQLCDLLERTEVKP